MAVQQYDRHMNSTAVTEEEECHLSNRKV